MSGIIDAILKTLGGEARAKVMVNEAKAPPPPTTSQPRKVSSHEMHPLAPPFHPKPSFTAPSRLPEDIDTDNQPVLMSPVRVASGRSMVSHSTPHNSSSDTGNISSLSGIDLSFGPQSVPFVFLRRKDAPHQPTPSKPPSSGSQSKRVQILADSPMPAITPNVTALSLESGEIYESDSEPEYEVVTPKEMDMSQWRKDQLKFMKAPRLVKGTVLMAIPTLHGPNNLPYARNPSGADAQISDDSRLSHVFSGQSIVQAPAPLSIDHIKPHTVYINSQLRHPMQLVDEHVPQEDAVLPGLESHPHPKVSQSASHTPVHGSPMSLSSSVNSTQSAPVPTASAILRAQLGVQKQKLVTIPGSPSVPPGNPIDDLFRAMTVQAQEPHVDPPATGSQSGGSQKENIPPKAQAGRTGPQGPIEGATFGTTPRIPSNETTQSSKSGTGTHSTSRTTISLPMTPAQHSKADKSINWRDRAGEGEPELPSVVVTSPNKSSFPALATEGPAKPDHMTIDSLFEKFSNKEVLDHNPAITFKPPNPVKSPKEPAHLPLPSSPSVATPPPRAPLGEATGQNVTEPQSKSPKGKKSPSKKDRIAAVKAIAPSTKGTPNAGKLLRKAKGLTSKDVSEGDKATTSPETSSKDKAEIEVVEKNPERSSGKGKGKGKAKAMPAKADEQAATA